ncbi:MAG: ribulokinase [Candidatus Marinimicrobia bacterium]|nr:ribulokinase [Candidatus Neomarinimicrobiota bacterium]
MYAIGLDYGTNSVRSVIINTQTGEEVGTHSWVYETGEKGIILDAKNHNLARQNPADYIKGFEITIKKAIEMAKENDSDFSSDKVIGIGTATTGSTPLPVNEDGTPLAMLEKYKENPNAHAWLWKDHTAYQEAEEITRTARENYPHLLAKYGDVYSSEWFFSKIWHCLNIDEEIFDAAKSWVELCDFVPAVLAGKTKPEKLVRSRCAAGHKAMFNEEWGGLPSKDFLGSLDPKLAELRDDLFEKTYTSDKEVGKLSQEWADKLGLNTDVSVAVGAFDAHLGAVGAGAEENRLIKIMGTSTCDIIISKEVEKDIPGICGIVNGSVVPGYHGLEAGQSAVGDIFNWFVNVINPGSDEQVSHEDLTIAAQELKPGESGLLALDWNNGNRTILVDQRLTGLLLGQTLHTTPGEIYRALVEATAFGALAIINRFEEYGVEIKEVVNCGGISEKNELIMQIYADVTGREMKISKSSETCALGGAISAAVASGQYDKFEDMQEKVCETKEKTFTPIPENHAIYKKLFDLYMQLHDSFGKEGKSDLQNVMKELLDIKEEVRKQ